MRQKLELIRAAAAPAHGPTVLLDADVLARKPLAPFVERLHAGDLFMHKREYVLSESRRSGNRKLWAVACPARTGGSEDDDCMWNSGVLAVPPADRGLLDEALALYDTLGAAGVRHFATEQLVEGVVLGRTGRLKPAEDWFVHYWGNKPGYDAEIARRLADAFIEGMSVKEAAAQYREKPIDLPVEVRQTRREKLAAGLVHRRKQDGHGATEFARAVTTSKQLLASGSAGNARVSAAAPLRYPRPAGEAGTRASAAASVRLCGLWLCVTLRSRVVRAVRGLRI